MTLSVRNKDSFVDRVQKSRKNPHQYMLANDDQKRLVVVQELHRQLQDARTIKQIYPKLRELFPDFKWSLSTVYRMKEECMQLYGNKKLDPEYYRGLILDWQLKALQVAQIRNDLKEWNKAIANLIKLLGLDKDTMELPEFDKYMNQVFVMNVTMNNNKYQVDLSQIDKIDDEVKQALLQAEDVEFEDIK